MGDRAAVVIGVDKTGGLTPLKSAAAGADRVAKFLKKEGFDVKLLTDANKPVSASDIFKAVDRFVKPPVRYRMLVVYFSGHGYLHNRSDLWLLSGAPVNPAEAINLRGATELARYCGIPNVVFISDACRSLAVELGAARLTAQDGFPNYAEITSVSKVDVFRATGPARAAYEGKIGEEVQSLLTAALLSAYVDGPPEIVKTVDEAGEAFPVVPNRALEDYLQDKVDELLAAIDFNLAQPIETDVPSDDDVYIARFRGKRPAAGLEGVPKGTTATTQGRAPASRGRAATRPVRRLAADLVRETLDGARPGKGVLDDPSVKQATRAQLGAEIAANVPSDAVTHFETETGLSVTGAAVKQILVCRPGQAHVDLVEAGDGKGQVAIARIATAAPGSSMLVVLADGRSFPLAALHGYIAHCTVGDAGLANVGYVPSTTNWRWGEYQFHRERLDRLRAKVAVAANHGSFSLSDRREAQRFADEIRVSKALDPTLGLYAAYAYSQAGDDGAVRSVLDYMRGDLAADLFDVRMLAFRTPPKTDLPLLPPCPLLTQGWNLLGPRRIELRGPLAPACAHLTGSLWTTFTPVCTDTLLKAHEKGDL